jgi:hypothetical protein
MVEKNNFFKKVGTKYVFQGIPESDLIVKVG